MPRKPGSYNPDGKGVLNYVFFQGRRKNWLIYTPQDFCIERDIIRKTQGAKNLKNSPNMRPLILDDNK